MLVRHNMGDFSFVHRSARKSQLAMRAVGGMMLPVLWAFASAGTASGAPGPSETFDVSLSSTTTTSTSSQITNSLSPITIPDAPGATYDAADPLDTGTVWNSLICPNNPTDPTQTIHEGADFVDSHGNASSVNAFIYIENNNFGIIAGNPQPFTTSGPGTDGLAANPAQLMTQGWQDPNTTSFIAFNIQGLPNVIPVTVYLYGSGPANGDGATVNVNGVTTTSTTEPNSAAIYRSVFDSTGSNPAPENGLTWVESATVDTFAGGGLVISIEPDSSTGFAGSINGFQIQEFVPEPATIGSLLLGASMIAFRRRRTPIFFTPPKNPKYAPAPRDP